jgi:cyclin-dependent kinase 7
MKIGDLGMSRDWGHHGEVLSPQVVTRWYRAPELFYGARLYDGRAIDVWALGCILVEMYNRAPLFPGSSDIDQLGRIFSVCGTPNATSWPGCEKLPDFIAFDPSEAQSLAEVCPKATDSALSLMTSMLQLDPRKRANLESIVSSAPFWQAAPPPVPCHELLPPSLLPKDL